MPHVDPDPSLQDAPSEQDGALRTAAPGPHRRGPAILLGLVLGLFLGILVFAGIGRLATHTTASAWHRFLSLFVGSNTSIDLSAPAVLERIQKLSRLETVDYSIDKIVEGERTYALLPNFLTGDKLLLIAHGEVIAGVDLSRLQAGDLVIQGRSITVHLPAAQILTTRLDNQRTKVYSRSTGLLVSADPNLESTVRQAAEQQLTQAAIAEGILGKAQENAQASLRTLLESLGFSSVTVR